jgi:hypothetical protein
MLTKKSVSNTRISNGAIKYEICTIRYGNIIAINTKVTIKIRVLLFIDFMLLIQLELFLEKQSDRLGSSS